ncbi:MAG: T9SS type A sorting domain-containing protein [Cyclobacteriaceae bacterium]
MTKVLFIVLFLMSSVTLAQSPIGCGSANWSSSVANTIGGTSFSVPAGSGSNWTYRWVVTSPALQIVSGQGTTTAFIRGVSGNSAGTIYVTRYKDGVSACTDYKNVTISGSGSDPLPYIGCIGFDPVIPEDSDPTGTLNYAFVNFGNQVSSNGITFTWYFRFSNGTLLQLSGQNPTFREKCPNNPVVAFGVIVTNGTNTAKYGYGPSTGPNSIPEFFGYNNARTCFVHPRCGLEGRLIVDEVKLFPKPAQSTIKLDGLDSNIYTIEIFDTSGNLQLQQRIANDELNINSLKKGTYLYILTDDKGLRQKGKILKE